MSTITTWDGFCTAQHVHKKPLFKCNGDGARDTPLSRGPTQSLNQPPEYSAVARADLPSAAASSTTIQTAQTSPVELPCMHKSNALPNFLAGKAVLCRKTAHRATEHLEQPSRTLSPVAVPNEQVCCKHITAPAAANGRRTSTPSVAACVVLQRAVAPILSLSSEQPCESLGCGGWFAAVSAFTPLLSPCPHCYAIFALRKIALLTATQIFENHIMLSTNRRMVMPGAITCTGVAPSRLGFKEPTAGLVYIGHG
jgi:hypothetical protein